MPVALETPDQPEVIALIADLDAYQDSLYPPESRYALDVSSLTKPNVRFAVARDDDGQAIGCGAVVLYEGYGELKRMYVSQDHRGKGIAGDILTLLEAAGSKEGYRTFKLETGPAQPDALAFYAKNGYAQCDRYADYRDDPNSVYMQKELAPT